jgi:hypothetical protein
MSRRSTFWRAVVLGVVLSAGGVVSPAGSVSLVHACSCADPLEDVELMLGYADAAFVGTVTEIRRPELAVSSMAESRFVFAVATVYAGEEVYATQSIVTASDGASCGLELQVGATALVFARDSDTELTPDPGELVSSLCEVASTPIPADVLSALGPERQPLAGSSPIGADDGLASTATRNWYWLAAAAIGSVTALIALRRVRHRR